MLKTVESSYTFLEMWELLFHHHTCFISRLARSAEMEGKSSQDLNCWTLFPVPVCGCSLVSFSSASAFALKYLSFIKKDLKWLIWKENKETAERLIAFMLKRLRGFTMLEATLKTYLLKHFFQNSERNGSTVAALDLYTCLTRSVSH